MQIQKTKDYSSFKMIVSNREVDKSHVKRLAKSIQRKNLLYLRPVICNDKMQVIDGQHRIAACEQIKELVHFIQVDGLSKEDIAILNTAQKNWTRIDFVNFYSIEGREAYKKLGHLVNKYPVRISFLLTFCVQDGKNMRDGNLQWTGHARCIEVCEWILQLKDKFPFVTERDFCNGLNQIAETRLEFNKILRTASVETFYKCNSKQEYKRMLKALIK